MDGFSKIEYVDAFYISDDNLEKVGLYSHTAYGKIIKTNEEFVVFSFIRPQRRIKSAVA